MSQYACAALIAHPVGYLLPPASTAMTLSEYARSQVVLAATDAGQDVNLDSGESISTQADIIFQLTCLLTSMIDELAPHQCQSILPHLTINNTLTPYSVLTTLENYSIRNVNKLCT